MKAIIIMNTEEFKDLCRVTGNAISSLRSCRECERHAEAKRVREWVAVLELAKLSEFSPVLEDRRVVVLELARWVLGDLG